MKILRFLVRFIIYVVILFPLLSNILGGKWYSNVIAFVILLAIGSILELRGIMKHVVDSILGLFAGVMKNQDNPEYKKLFQMTQRINKDDIELVSKMLEKFRND